MLCSSISSCSLQLPVHYWEKLLAMKPRLVGLMEKRGLLSFYFHFFSDKFSIWRSLQNSHGVLGSNVERSCLLFYPFPPPPDVTTCKLQYKIAAWTWTCTWRRYRTFLFLNVPGILFLLRYGEAGRSGHKSFGKRVCCHGSLEEGHSSPLRATGAQVLGRGQRERGEGRGSSPHCGLCRKGRARQVKPTVWLKSFQWALDYADGLQWSDTRPWADFGKRESVLDGRSPMQGGGWRQALRIDWFIFKSAHR